MEVAAAALESHRGRDRFLRALGYSSRLLGGLLQAAGTGSDGGGGPGLHHPLLRLSQELGNCRATLRLLDDLAMFLHSRGYGLGAAEEDAVVRWLSVVANMADQLYYPCEHVAWAADYKILNIHSSKWWTLSNVLWSVSLALGVLRSLRVLQQLKRKLKQGRRDHLGTEELKQLHLDQVRKRAETLNLISNLSDLANAVHWMPRGILWAGRFPEWLVGLMGTISSLIGLYQMWYVSSANKDP
ncbi:peroxisomal membrane protein 11C [Amblyraja radiata]|uniref:peroxisomal membrane protein 11C n=1 Tax=Amblyraja radiata TaxID=386614 RepID=UPI0014036F70|nr:peroxisomal membrane protein 11C [Amblyraja radiata]XP_032902878.1 peroxisomal membrane protein 11C [Amblyraja radiata]